MPCSPCCLTHWPLPCHQQHWEPQKASDFLIALYTQIQPRPAEMHTHRSAWEAFIDYAMNLLAVEERKLAEEEADKAGTPDTLDDPDFRTLTLGSTALPRLLQRIQGSRAANASDPVALKSLATITLLKNFVEALNSMKATSVGAAGASASPMASSTGRQRPAYIHHVPAGKERVRACSTRIATLHFIATLSLPVMAFLFVTRRACLNICRSAFVVAPLMRKGAPSWRTMSSLCQRA